MLVPNSLPREIIFCLFPCCAHIIIVIVITKLLVRLHSKTIHTHTDRWTPNYSVNVSAVSSSWCWYLYLQLQSTIDQVENAAVLEKKCVLRSFLKTAGLAAALRSGGSELQESRRVRQSGAFTWTWFAAVASRSCWKLLEAGRLKMQE